MQQAAVVHARDLHADELARAVGAGIVHDHAMEAAERTAVAKLEHGRLARTDARTRVGLRGALGHMAKFARAGGHDLGCHLSGSGGGGGAGAGAVAEHVHTGKAHALTQGAALGELLVRLAGEAGDDVAGNGGVRELGADVVDHGLVLLGRVGAVHALERGRAAGL